MPARNSIVAELVPREKMYNAIALNNGASNIARVAGPALAGVLIGLVGTQGAYYVGVGFNALAIVTISFLPLTSKLGLIKGKSALTNLKEGFAYLRINNIILILLGMEIGLTIFGMSYQGLMPVFADLLHAGSEKYGFMMSAVGIGSLVGVFGMASLGNFRRKGLVLIGAGVVFGLFLVVFGNTVRMNLGDNAYYVALIALFVVGMSAISYTATGLTIIQMYISDEYRGRVTSMYQIVIALYPFSILLSSAVAQAIGAPLALTIGGSCLAVFMITMAIVNKRVRSLE
jgi:MFS family permease